MNRADVWSRSFYRKTWFTTRSAPGPTRQTNEIASDLHESPAFTLAVFDIDEDDSHPDDIHTAELIEDEHTLSHWITMDANCNPQILTFHDSQS